MGWNWTQTSICDIHSLKHMFFYSHLSVHWNTLTKTERNLEKQPWETPFPLNMLHSPRYSSLAHLPLSWSHDRPPATAMQLPDLFSNHVWEQGKLQPAVWNVCMCECDFTGFPWCCGGFPRSGGNITQSVLKYVISEPCPHTGVQTHAIINSWSLISFDDGTLASFCYWMWWLYCTFVSRGLLQNELLHLLFNALNSE